MHLLAKASHDDAQYSTTLAGLQAYEYMVFSRS